MNHDELCEKKNGWYVNPECADFSTDGTRLGAHIAHQMGTMSEEAIIYQALTDNERMKQEALTGMDEEQADWEEEDCGSLPADSTEPKYPIHDPGCGCWYCVG